MTDLKMLWQQFTNKEGGEKKRRDRWMLLACTESKWHTCDCLAGGK